jgi:hypothetical protein
MTDLDKQFIQAKRTELLQSMALFGNMAQEWDITRFMKIIISLERENRRLRTQLAEK